MMLGNVSALKICVAITTYIDTLLRVIPNHFIANNWINCIYVPADNPRKKASSEPTLTLLVNASSPK